MNDYSAKDLSEPEDGDIRDDIPENIDKRAFEDMNNQIQIVLQDMKDKFQTMSDQILSRIDDMGARIDDLEKNISDLMIHAGLETPDK
ncbi:PREDICTED: heat shock factor-binding protein 1 [Diuraphis noxia]|uniref:heat shock factor-binding protein 1 n=1 Tax=Diuraphis noxia TaxID=143948 RepID=UPI000763591A|nr:PREDICTED: heat shock factor-binding protein 1 [Diuraphis noxia]XP_015374153.1 PREDICTED: heat shock factor-binding protein 1 [Diuraphis noxia]